jgi:ribosomal protein S12 methylthiotransferase
VAGLDMSSSPHKPPVRVGLINLGCAKNLVDAEIMLGHLLKEGIQVTNDPARADVVIVNTCSFIDAAQEESVDLILESAAWREVRQRRQALVVAGCLPQRFRDELPRLLPEVDLFMGIDQVAQAPSLVRQALHLREQRLAIPPLHCRSDTTTKSICPAPHQNVPGMAPRLEVHRKPAYIPDFTTPRFRLTPIHFAYLKIAEGCNHPCSFCIIPRIRGSHRSRPLQDILREARRLVAEGVRELNLISQDSTYYGLDLRPHHRPNIAAPERFQAATRTRAADTPTLAELLRELNALPGDFWIRLLYTHPAHWTDELIRTIADCPKVARYIDIPLQHIHPVMLERMRRETSQEHIVNLLRQIRARLPGVALRTTFVVGFPGETNSCFQTLLDFIRDTRFERLGVFTYSREQGTLAGRMEQQIPDRVKRTRRDQAMALQHTIAREICKSFLGRSLQVLVEREASSADLRQAQIHSWEHGLLRETDGRFRRLRGRYLVARSAADAPDIDGRVYVRGRLPLGNFAQVKIIGHTDYDLIAEP